jgi:hypothetical protein
MMEGVHDSATLNKDRIIFSLSPTHLLVSEDAEHENKEHLLSWAIALTINVFPVPGGPYRSIASGGDLRLV